MKRASLQFLAGTQYLFQFCKTLFSLTENCFRSFNIVDWCDTMFPYEPGPAWEGEISPRSNGSSADLTRPVLMRIKSQKHILKMSYEQALWLWMLAEKCGGQKLFYFYFYKFAIAIDLYRVLWLQMTGISTQR